MYAISPEKILKVLIVECYTRRNLFFVLFTCISLAFLIAGLMWPKNYTAFTIIHIDDTNILQPLMKGAAETTQTTDHVDNAKEIIFGEKIMDQLLIDTGWLESSPSDVQQARIKEHIKSSLSVKGMGKNLIIIEYTDKDQMRAYKTTKRLGELFIEAGEDSKVEESQSAYDFIQSQVNDYLLKLVTIEKELREFRSNNPDARPGQQNQVSNRITQLQRDIEDTKLLLREATIKKNSIREQLSGEAAITISQSKESRYREQMAELQTQLELLSLDYMETYPDIVRLKAQISDLKTSLSNEMENRKIVRETAKKSGNSYVDETIILSPLYQELRSNLSATETNIATLATRIDVLNTTLEKEYDRARKIYSGEETLSQLTRNYQVNQDIYQDLLRRLESARVSKNLDEEQKGYTFKIQEPAKLPLIPTGIRFMHFAIAGLLAGLAIPIGLIYLLIQLDPRIRFSQIITSELDIPVIAEINIIKTDNDRKKIKFNLVILSILMTLLLTAYFYVSWLRYMGQI